MGLSAKQIKKEIQQIESLEERFLDMLVFTESFDEEQQKLILKNIMDISTYYVRLRQMLDNLEGDNDED